MLFTDRSSDLPNLERVIDYHPPIVDPDATAIAAITLMHRPPGSEHKLPPAVTDRSARPSSSYVLVVEGSRPIGILTARDLLGSIAAGLDLTEVKVRELMTAPIITLARSQARDLPTALSLMRQHQIRHLPIVDERGELIGMLAERDLCQWLELPISDEREHPQLDSASQLLQPELELSSDRDRLAAFFSQSPDGFFFMMLAEPIQWDDAVDKEALLDYVFSHQLITKVNAAMLAQYDATEEDFIGLTPHDFFAHDLATGRQLWREMFDNGRLHVETCERKLDGTSMWIEGDYSCLYDSNGQIIGHFGIQRDISTRKQAERELRQLHERLQQQAQAHTAALLEVNRQLQVAIGKYRQTAATLYQSQQELTDFVENAIVGLHWVAADGTIIWANQAELDLLGYTREEYIGHSITEFHVDRAAIEDILVRLLSDRPVRSYEADLRCKDGSIRHVSIDSNSSWRDGKFVRTRCFTHDITERKRAQAELERFNDALSHATEGIALLDLQGRYVQINQAYASTVGYSPAAMVGMDWQLTVHPEDLPRMQLAYEHMLEHGKVEVAARGIRCDGSVFYKQLVMVTAADSQQQPIGHYCFMKDISAAKQAEADLTRSEQKFRAIFDSMFQFICMLTPDGTIVEANRTALDAVAAERSAIVGRPFWDTPWWNHSPLLQARVKQAIVSAANGELVQFESEHIWADGTAAFIDFSLKPVVDETGKVVMLIPEGRDITERKQIEAELRSSQQRLQSMLDNSTAVIYVKDIQGRYISINRSYEVLFHLDRHEIVGKTDRDIFPSEFADAFQANDRAVIAAGMAIEKEEVAQQDDGLHTYLSIKFPLFDAGGHIYAVCGMSTDISTLKHREEMLRNISLGVATKTDKSLFQALAEYLTKTLGVEFAFISELIPPHHERVRTIAGYGDGRALENFEYALANTPCAQIVGKQLCIYPERVQQQFPLDTYLQDISAESFIGAPLFDSTGRALGAISVCSHQPLRDPQLMAEILNIFAVRAAAELERQQAEVELQNQKQDLARSNDELQQFAYVASHDLQEPLRMITSYLELLERRYKGQLDAKADTFIAYAVDGASRMQTLINDLLNYSRVGTKGQDFVVVDCEQILQTVLLNLKVAISDSQAIVTHAPLPQVKGDPAQLIQLFQNTIGNAIKFHGQEPPQIQIGAESVDGKWLFSVRDNGIGMDSQYLERIFIIFQRLHSKTEYPGTGIGLAVCKKIVERHGGTLWVESQPGRGSTFYFTLPHPTTSGWRSLSPSGSLSGPLSDNLEDGAGK